MDKKIEDGIVEHTICKEMRPVYSTNTELMCGVIEYNGKTYLFDFGDIAKIINFNKKFVFADENDIYPSYPCNYKRFTYLDFLYIHNSNDTCFVFKNNNRHDLRRTNIEIYHRFHKQIVEQYDVIEYIPGHYQSTGQDANIMKNPIWKIRENEKDYLLMYCEKDTICKLCNESYQKILDYEIVQNKKSTWFKMQNGYISGSHNLYMHQIIAGCYGNGKGIKTVSVDHVDRDKLNNTMENLRTATMKEQQDNQKGNLKGTKKERQCSAKPLPDGITQNMMRKYVVFYEECTNKETQTMRQFFKVESNPKLKKPWFSCKSCKMSIQDKLAQANKVVEDLENNIYPENPEQILPKYISLIVTRDKPHLVFEKRVGDKRHNVKMVLPEEYDLEAQVDILNDKIKKKYGDDFVY